MSGSQIKEEVVNDFKKYSKLLGGPKALPRILLGLTCGLGLQSLIMFGYGKPAPGLVNLGLTGVAGYSYALSRDSRKSDDETPGYYNSTAPVELEIEGDDEILDANM